MSALHAQYVDGLETRIKELEAENAALKEALDEVNCPRKYVRQGGVMRCLYGTSSISAYEELETKNAALKKEKLEVFNETLKTTKQLLTAQRRIKVLREALAQIADDQDTPHHINARNILATPDNAEIDALVEEIDTLKMRIHNAYEVYAGLEGIKRPLTDREQYLLDRIREMARELKS